MKKSEKIEIIGYVLAIIVIISLFQSAILNIVAIFMLFRMIFRLKEINHNQTEQSVVKRVFNFDENPFLSRTCAGISVSLFAVLIFVALVLLLGAYENVTGNHGIGDLVVLFIPILLIFIMISCLIGITLGVIAKLNKNKSNEAKHNQEDAPDQKAVR